MSEVLLTCGGTSEAVDEVRVLTNISAGRFGHALAAALAKYPAYQVTEVCPRATRERFGETEGVKFEHYRSTADLQRVLFERETPPAVAIQAAAVSDYRPVPTEGKISSDQENLTIHLERTPKLLSLMRPTYGPKTFLVGFKLLVGVPREELIRVAQAQLKKNRLNMVVANDLRWLQEGRHPILVITAEGGVIPMEGTREEVAAELAEFIHTREQVSWFRSVPSSVALPSDTRGQFEATLRAVEELNLLTDASGNISARADDSTTTLRISPRGVDKSKMKLEDSLLAFVDNPYRTIYFQGEGKPSIDTGVESLIYDAYMAVDTIIHFHRGWGRADAATSYPYPCGVVEEGREVLATLGEADVFHPPFNVELVHHGFLLGLTAADLQVVLEQWRETLHEFARHVEEVRPEHAPPALRPLDPKLYQPIWDGSAVVGLLHNDPQATVVYCRESTRGSGLGRVLIDQLIERRMTIQTVDDCHVRDFYRKFGFTETETDGVFHLTPPERPLPKHF